MTVESQADLEEARALADMMTDHDSAGVPGWIVRQHQLDIERLGFAAIRCAGCDRWFVQPVWNRWVKHCSDPCKAVAWRKMHVWNNAEHRYVLRLGSAP